MVNDREWETGPPSMLSDRDDNHDWYGRLRAQAKQRLNRMLEASPVRLLSRSEATELIHELQIYQAELEIQNEELRCAQHELEDARDRFRDLYDFAPVGYLSVGVDGRIQEGNLTAAGLLRVPRAGLIGSHFFRWVHEDDRQTFLHHRKTVLEQETGHSCEVRLAAEGSEDECFVRMDSVAVRDVDGKATGFRTALTDIALRRGLEQRWRLADTVIESSGEGIVVLDPQRRIARINGAFAEQSGQRPESLKGRDLQDLLATKGDTEALEAAWLLILRGERWTGELQLRRVDGTVLPLRASLTAVDAAPGRGVSHVAAMFVDVAALKQHEETMRYRAHYDAITGLPNRMLLTDRLAEAIKEARRHGAQIGFLMIDLDRFKQVNDEFGHSAGDTLLRDLAARLVGCVRDHDTVGRLAGDEFAIVLKDVAHGKDIAPVAEKLVQTLAEPYRIEGAEIQCSASIGIAVYPSDTEELDGLQRYADMAMYRAKLEGRNRYRFFDATMSRHVEARLRTRTDMTHALQRNEFEILYQPLMHAATGQLAGAEALLRWRHPQQGLLSPTAFLQLAEETGQIRALGEWVIRQVRRSTAKWPALPGAAPLLVSINVSPRQCSSPDARAQLLQAVRECSFASGSLAMEITENIPLETGAVIDCMDELRQMGVRMVMDDFGTGYSSLGLLRTLPFDVVKIDQTFVEGVECDASVAHLVDTIIYMARGLNMTVIAEGVETDKQLAFLREHHCDYVQGSLLGLPMAEETFLAFVSEQAGIRAP